jgi:hypothetical protein
MNIGMTASRQFKFNLYFLKLQGKEPFGLTVNAPEPIPWTTDVNRSNAPADPLDQGRRGDDWFGGSIMRRGQVVVRQVPFSVSHCS